MCAPSAGRRLARVLLLAAAFAASGAGRRAAAQATTTEPGNIPALEARLRRLESQIEQLSRGLADQATAPASPTPTPFDSGATPDLTPFDSGATPDLPARSPAAPPRSGVAFGPGFELATHDGEYQLQFHNITQIDARAFQQGGQDPVKDTFGIPRQWFIISGRLTRPYEYYASFAESFAGTTSVLDAFVNFHFDDRFQIKAGRFFVPFTYEPYVIPIHALITPEWSLFFNNFEPNRDLGVMAWGRLAGDRVDYAAGVFNGAKNGFVDTNDAKDVIGFLNTKPFRGAGIAALENLNVGGSVLAGRESSGPIPQTLRTAVSIPGNATIGVPFLTFNDNVRETGPRALWSLHAAYFYRHLSVIGEWDGGYQEYSNQNQAHRTRVPLRSFYVAAGYFLTGETVASRGVVQPLRPFDLRKGKFGPGAWELAGRYNALGIGGEVFTGGLADPNLWSDRVSTTDLGLNWYLNPFVKVAMFWEHAEFGQPVVFRPGSRQLTSDLFLLRLQLRF